MSTATAEPPIAPVSPPLFDLLKFIHPGQRLLLTGVSWDDYYQLMLDRTAAGRRGVRIAYDHGEMEIMVVSGTHERLKKIVAVLIEAWIVETGGQYLPSGGMTHHRDDLERGFEPDECYYVQNWRNVAGLRDIDFTKDPPPDLTVEVEVTRSALGKLPIYASFKIPEVWRYNGERLIVLLLQPDGSYRESPTSRALPTLPLDEFVRQLAAAATHMDFASIDRQFRAWVRQTYPAPPTT